MFGRTAEIGHENWRALRLAEFYPEFVAGMVVHMPMTVAAPSKTCASG